MRIILNWTRGASDRGRIRIPVRVRGTAAAAAPPPAANVSGRRYRGVVTEDPPAPQPADAEPPGAEPAGSLPRWCVLGRAEGGGIAAIDVRADGTRAEPVLVGEADLPAFVAARESGAGPGSGTVDHAEAGAGAGAPLAAGRGTGAGAGAAPAAGPGAEAGAEPGAGSGTGSGTSPAPRWVWSNTAHWAPRLLAAGVRVGRVHDLRLCHAILKLSASVHERAGLVAETRWDAGSGLPDPEPAESALFALDGLGAAERGVPHDAEAALTEFDRQRIAAASSEEPGRLGLLLAAESAGALVAAELAAAGVPWDAAEHGRLLEAALGPRPPAGAKPARMLEAADEVRAALGDPGASLDSPPKLLGALRRAGIDVGSTSRWELEEHEHPAIEPLLRYKKLARLLSANGWAWIDEWVRDGRYRPVYVPGGVVTGRWASSGGGALQLPRMLRPALRADPGWRLVSADVAQLEPRVLAAMSGDAAMAAAGRGRDLYEGIVASGIVADRQEAKIAVLGAMYGGTSGDSGRLAPRLRRGFPRAMRLVDDAAATGEQGGIVSTWLGRSSPEPGEEWRELQARASLPGATARDEDRARRSARDFGRFTRNFIVQGTAAEWALAWLAELRQRLAALPEAERTPPPHASGRAFERRAHLVFFLHDEVIVHAPEEQAEAAAAAIRSSAEAAGRLLFRGAPVDFPLDLSIGERATKD